MNVAQFLRHYAPVIYGPTALFTLGQGAVIPLIPIIAIDLGADIAMAALVSAAIIIGQVLGNLPAGAIVARFGERVTMVLSGTFALAGVLGMAVAPGLAVFTVAVFFVGLCTASFGIARHAFMTKRVPFHFRARSLSLLGGVYRLGIFLGPFIGSAVVKLTGDNRTVCWWFALCVIAAVLLVWLGPDPERAAAGTLAEEPPVTTAPVPLGVLRTVVQHRGVLARLGTAAAAMSAVRAARHVVLPLWGESIGLDSATILLVVGFSGALDFALFYLSGQVMDRYGRMWAAIPSLAVMAVAFLSLSFTHEWASAHVWYMVCSLAVGLGNGISSGILMTLGADLAPEHDPAPFLGAWHTITDGGSAATPIMFSAVVALATVPVATALIGVVAVLGAAGFLRWMPRHFRRE